VQGATSPLLGAIALLHVDGEERETRHAEDKQGSETACGA
jgi:hypothetical protein